MAAADDNPNASSKFWMPHFHAFALRGVADVLEMVKRHRCTLQSYPPFVP